MPGSVAWAVDCLVSALSGGAAGQTISARLGEAVRQGSTRAIPYARAVDWLAIRWPLYEENHCARSDEAYRARLDAAPFGG
jgi:hypothetical protein